MVSMPFVTTMLVQVMVYGQIFTKPHPTTTADWLIKPCRIRPGLFYWKTSLTVFLSFVRLDQFSRVWDWQSNLILITTNWINSQIPEWSGFISHNAPFRTEMCTFLFWMGHCGIWNRCILGFMKLVYYPWCLLGWRSPLCRWPMCRSSGDRRRAGCR